MPEEVKTKHTLLIPDVRRTMIVLTNQRTGVQRPITFDDHEARVSEIPLPSEAPEEVQDQLATAKNLLLYSWYYYPFTMSASLHATAALEQALRLRLAATERDTLGFLLKEAIERGIITSVGFPRWMALRKLYRQWDGASLDAPEEDLARLLTKTLPHFRNTLAHGNRFVDDVGFIHLDLACEAILQLFPSTLPQSR